MLLVTVSDGSSGANEEGDEGIRTAKLRKVLNDEETSPNDVNDTRLVLHSQRKWIVAPVSCYWP